jgi:hypothetical protein
MNNLIYNSDLKKLQRYDLTNYVHMKGMKINSYFVQWGSRFFLARTHCAGTGTSKVDDREDGMSSPIHRDIPGAINAQFFSPN